VCHWNSAHFSVFEEKQAKTLSVQALPNGKNLEKNNGKK